LFDKDDDMYARKLQFAYPCTVTTRSYALSFI